MRAAVAVVACLLGANAFAMGAPKKEVPAWERMGRRWAFQLDEEGRRVALYDLAFPDLSGTSKVNLGVLDLSREASDEVRRLIEQGLGQGQGSDVAAAKKASEALSVLAATRVQEALPDGWWRQIPWRDGAMARSMSLADAPPARFSVADVDLPRAVKDVSVLNDALARLGGFPELGSGFLSRFEFVRDSRGCYQLFYSPNGAGPKQGYRLASLEHPTERMWVAVGWDVAEQALGLLIGQITVPVLGPMIGTAAGRFLFYRQELLRLHEEMAFEALDGAEEGASPRSPLAALSPAERVRLAESLVLGQSSWITAWQWIVRKPEREWRSQLRKDQSQARRSRDWLARHSERLEPLGDRYGIAVDGAGRRRLTLLARPRLLDSVRPSVAVDYADPRALARYRRGVEAASVAADFASRLIPVVGGVVYEAYYALVEKPVRVSQRWEARLGRHLEERMAADARERWAYELGVIDGQRFNPFAVSRDVEHALAEQRWARLSRAMLAADSR